MITPFLKDKKEAKEKEKRWKRNTQYEFQINSYSNSLEEEEKEETKNLYFMAKGDSNNSNVENIGLLYIMNF